MTTRKTLKNMEILCFVIPISNQLKAHISMGTGDNAYKIVCESSH